MRLLFAGTNFPGLTLLTNSTHALYTPGLFTEFGNLMNEVMNK